MRFINLRRYDDTEELQQHNGHRALTGGPSIARDKKRQIQKLERNEPSVESLLNIRLNKIYDNRTAQQFF